jgi:gluconate 2-dehydrogenase gamma chain
VRAHTMQGFYGDPRHGGNRDRASWKMVGLSYPPIRGQEKY